MLHLRQHVSAGSLQLGFLLLQRGGLLLLGSQRLLQAGALSQGGITLRSQLLGGPWRIQWLRRLLRARCRQGSSVRANTPSM